MAESLQVGTKRLMALLHLDEAPYGVCYCDAQPEGFGPKEGEIYTREREEKGLINWQKAFGSDFRCFIGSVYLARKKRKAAWISHEACGCMGCGYYCGLYRPYLENNVAYVSTGMPGVMEGEHYLSSPESMRAFMDDSLPPEAPKKYVALKPIEDFGEEEPLVVCFFIRPEMLAGLFNLTCYAAGNYQAVASPFGAGCTSLVGWPLIYQARGEERAVLGGFDVSARKFFNNDEQSFAVPIGLYKKMLGAMETSCLPRNTWQTVLKKVDKSHELHAK